MISEKVHWAYAVQEQWLYTASATESKILKFNMETAEYSVCQIGDYSFAYWTMVYDGDIQRIHLLDQGNDILVFPSSGNKIKRFNKLTGEVSVCYVVSRREEIADGKVLGNTNSEFGLVMRLKDTKIVVGDVYELYFLVIDTITDEIQRYPIRMSKNMLNDLNKERIKGQRKLSQIPYGVGESAVGLAGILDYCLRLEDIKQQPYTEYGVCYELSGGCGKIIHDIIMMS